MFVKIGDFIKFKGFLVEFLRGQAILRKSKTSRKSPEKWTFLSLALYNAPSLDTVDIMESTLQPKSLRNEFQKLSFMGSSKK